MSNYHVLESTLKLSSVRIAFHIAIPDEDNSVNVNLRIALNYYLGPRDNYSIVPNLEVDFSTEYAEIAAASKYEYATNHKFSNAHMTLIQKRNELDNQYTQYSASIVDDLRKKLKYYRLDRDVP